MRVRDRIRNLRRVPRGRATDRFCVWRLFGCGPLRRGGAPTTFSNWRGGIAGRGSVDVGKIEICVS